MKLPRISVEVFRDRGSPDAAVELAVRALQEMNLIFDDGLGVIDSGRLAPLGYPGVSHVNVDDVPTIETRADYGVVMTHNPLISSPGLQTEYDERNEIIVGIAITNGKEKPYGIINSEYPEEVSERAVQHEFGHLMDVKRNGENYDGEWHCSLEQCTMYRTATREKSDFCNECADQAAKYLFMRRRQKAGLLRRLFVL
ncbi:MAG: hypothetical protein H6797_04385 [Candidatus Nomurabacteria bacterium]|nr:MAG: hypothetical protein H6797_04385 [Candidatus Nomurabacteria bacterium]